MTDQRAPDLGQSLATRRVERLLVAAEGYQLELDKVLVRLGDGDEPHYGGLVRGACLALANQRVKHVAHHALVWRGGRRGNTLWQSGQGLASHEFFVVGVLLV